MKAILPSLFSIKARPRFSALRKAFPLFLIAFFASTRAAFAQLNEAVSMGDVFCNVANNMTPFIDVFDMTSYVAGVVFIVKGILHLKNHYDNPGQHPHHRTFGMFLAGGALLVLPYFIGNLIMTLYGMNNGSGFPGCFASSGGGSGTQTLDVMLTNMVNNIGYPLMYLTSAVAAIMGLWLIFRGLVRAAHYGTDARTTSTTNILTNLILGAILIAISSSLDSIMQSVLGISVHGIMTFEEMNWKAIDALGGDPTGFKTAMKAALTFFQIVGFISFVRGWNVIRNAVEGSGQATMAQGLTHIIGGVMAINIYSMIYLMDQTFGTGFVS